jgi:3-oxoacyl-[acyl-carrier protein] reductase
MCKSTGSQWMRCCFTLFRQLGKKISSPWWGLYLAHVTIEIQSAAESLRVELQSKYPKQLFICVSADLSSRESTRALVPGVLGHDAIVAKHNSISILVANAGLGRRIRNVAEIEEDDWDDMLEVNSRSQFVITKACLTGMRSQSWGRVILVGSIASRGGGMNGCHYAASKGALRWLHPS